MSSSLSVTPSDRIADWSLGLLIVLAPALGGSSSILALPILWFLAVVSVVSTVQAARPSADRPLPVLPFVVGLLAFGVYTAFQAVPLPSAALSLLSHRSFDVRSFVLPDASTMSLSYEPSATAREAAKLMLYALTSWVAYTRARRHRDIVFLARALVIAGLVTALVTLVHRALGVERIFGVLPTRTPIAEMITTFANPNHGASFMLLASLVAAGAAVTSRVRSTQVGYASSAILFAGLVVTSTSRAGLVALGVAMFLFAVLAPDRKARTRHRSSRSAREALESKEPRTPSFGLDSPVEPGTPGFRAAMRARMVNRWRWAAIGLSSLAVLAGLVAAIFQSQTRSGGGWFSNDLGPGGKLGAFRDAWPMVLEHFWLGIGRGSYVSVYPGYKTSPVQLTFAYPETILVQMVAEWGVVVGIVGFVGLAACVLWRFRHHRRVLETAALAGVAGVLLHNLVDFSLELPGVAIPFVALLGAVAHDNRPRAHLELGSRTCAFISAGVLATLAGLSVCAAFLYGDLDRDVAGLEVEGLPRDVVLRESEAAACRHPANAYLAARTSHAAEILDPPDLTRALRWANRSLLLAPTYADAHLAVGRLLVRFGYRSQGFVALREAWRLSSPLRRRAFVDYIVRLARDPEELRAAIPRAAMGVDVPNHAELSQLVSRLNANQRSSWAGRLFDGIDVTGLTPTDLEGLAEAALNAKRDDVAELAVQALLRMEPNNSSARLLWARALRHRGDLASSRALLESIARESAMAADRLAALRSLVRLGLEAKNDRAARSALHELYELQARVPDGLATRRARAELATLEADVAALEGDSAAAVRALTKAIDLAPEQHHLRLRRANLLAGAGRPHAARADVEAVLASRPTNAGALRLLERLRAQTPPQKEHLPSGDGEKYAPSTP